MVDDQDKPVPRRSFLLSSAAAAGAAALMGCQSQQRTRGGAGSGAATTQMTGDVDLDPSHGLGAEEANAPTVGGDRGFVRVMLTEADGSSLANDRARLLHVRDLQNDPLPQAIIRADGRVRVAIANEPIQIVCRLKIPNFGEVYAYADNEGQGYRKPAQIDFVVDAAKTRLQRVRDAVRKAKSLGIPADSKLDWHLFAAARPIPQEPGYARTAAAYESLAHGMHAGEMFALNAAKHRIARFPAPRKDFGFGVRLLARQKSIEPSIRE